MDIFNHIAETVEFDLLSKDEIEDFYKCDYEDDVPDSISDSSEESC